MERSDDEFGYQKQIKLMKSQIKMRCGKVRTILQYHGKIKVCIQKNMQIICFFCFTHSEMKNNNNQGVYQ